MQLLENWDPLNLPRGSVRAIVTLAFLGVLWTFLLLDQEIPLGLGYLTLLILGHYFGARSRETEKRPLFLPRGSIRLIIIAGFVIVGYFVWQDGRLDLTLDTPAGAVLVLTAALTGGFVVRKLADFVTRKPTLAPRRWFENIKAVAVLTATAFLVVCWVLQIKSANIDTLTLAATPLIGFYFGSRE